MQQWLEMFDMAWVCRRIGQDCGATRQCHLTGRLYEHNTQETQLTSSLQVDNADPMWHRHVYDRGPKNT